MTILEEAAQIIHGNREQTYGGPHANFPKIAAVWSAILGQTVTAEQVALCMACLKLVRLANSPGHQSRSRARGIDFTWAIANGNVRNRGSLQTLL